MKLGFVVNSVAGEFADYTTTHLALAALHRGADVAYIALEDFTYGPDERLHAWATRPRPNTPYRLSAELLGDLQSPDACRERIDVAELDVLMLRNDPSLDLVARPWARLAGINFGRLAARAGTIVLNDPDGLNHAINKTYLEQFPQSVRPRSLISRARDDIMAFAREIGWPVVMKPLTGSGGRNAFLIREEDRPNLNQMIEAVLRDGYVLVQEYLPEAEKGDTRLFMMNGEVLQKDGRIAAVRRVPQGGDMRTNITAGGRIAPPHITDDVLAIAEAFGPGLTRDGMFLVGLDIAGSKVMEVNVFSPGALEAAGCLAKVDFMPEVIAALERKVDTKRRHREEIPNVRLATL
jgi:glutathione synthase